MDFLILLALWGIGFLVISLNALIQKANKKLEEIRCAIIDVETAIEKIIK